MWMRATDKMLVLHKLRSVRSSDSISAPAEKPSILQHVFSEIPCCLLGQSINLSWPPTREAVSENEQVVKMHAIVYELLKDLSVQPGSFRSNGSFTKDVSTLDEKKINALKTLHEITACTVKENRYDYSSCVFVDEFCMRMITHEPVLFHR